MTIKTSLHAISHPDFQNNVHRWYEYRLTFLGGEEFLRKYIIRLEDETDEQFRIRKENTPIPAAAKEAIKDVRRSIQLRLVDVSRENGSKAYQAAVSGEGSGIDRNGQTMNMFIGQDVLTDLLVIGRVGVFVDNIAPEGATLADGPAQPYAYMYRAEDILNWDTVLPHQLGTFSMVLLRDFKVSFNHTLGVAFPTKREERLRLVWLGEDGFMRYKFFTPKFDSILPESLDPRLSIDDDGAVVTQLREIPFIMPSLEDSLLSDAASYQRLLLNVASNEGMFAMNINFPMLFIQKDTRAAATQWKRPPGGEPVPGGQRSRNAEVQTGVRSGWIRGRYYSLEEEVPQWGGPPVESLKESREYRAQLADEVRHLVNVAITNQVGQRTESRETKELSAQGLEAGLHEIAMRLQQTERQIAKYFAMYEGTDNVATIAYPKRFSLKSQADRIKDAKDLIEVTNNISGQSAKQVGQSAAFTSLFTGMISSNQMEEVLTEIRKHPYIGDFDNIMALVEAGLMKRETAAESQDLDPEEVEEAMKEKIEIATKITLASQTRQEDSPDRPAARGIPEIDANQKSGEEERAEDGKKRGNQKASTAEDKE